MKTGRPAILAICICILLVPLAAYELGGESAPTTNCNDGVDNDFDNKTDGDDPGCSKPYYQDNSEANIFDLDVTNVFADIQPGDSASTIKSKLIQGPSIYYGWNVTSPDKVSATYWPDNSFTSSDGSLYINETWVEGSKKTYGGGNVTWAEIDITGLAVTTSRNSGHAGVIDTPGTGTSDECGDGIQQSSENTANCPEDAGLPAQINRANGTISGDLGTYSIQGEDGSSHSDDVMYDVGPNGGDLYLSEYSTAGASCTNVGDVECDNIQGMSSDSSKLYETGSWKNVPDFVVRDSGTEIHAVFPNLTETDVNEVDNDILHSSESVNHFADNGRTAKFGCEGDCVIDQQYCTDISGKSVTDYSLEKKTKIIGHDAQEYNTSSDGGLGYNVNSDSVPMAVEVTYDDATSSQMNYQSCSKTQYSAACGSTGSCNLSNEKTVYSKGSKSYNPGYDTYTKDYDIETVTFNSWKIFDLDPGADNPIGVAPKTALFNDDFNTGNIVQRSFSNTGYFSLKVPHDNKDQGNDYSISTAYFGIITGSSDNFVSQRKGSTTYDADGSRGFGDGFVAINDSNIIGSTNGFLNAEITDGSGASFVSKSDAENQLSLTCPGDSIKCVASVDVRLQNFDQWSSDDPSSGLSFHITDEGPHNLSDSYGATKMYMALTDNDKEVTECTGDDCGGGGGTITDQDNYNPVCGDEPGERYIFMEGPEIDEQKMDSEDASTYGKCIDTSKSSLSGSACNFKNDPVPEGHVGNVAPDYTTLTFEQGGNSPDMEICLDLQGTGIRDEGDEVAGDNYGDDINEKDYGGEWYDLDSETGQQYLRGVEDGTYSTESGDKLVSDGDSSDPNDIAYYWNNQVNQPQDSQYNPQGGQAGTALEDDCGNSRFDGLKCDDQNSVNDRGHGSTNTFFSFFQEGLNDEDFHPQGGSSDEIKPLSGFTGTINRLQSISNQLQPGMDTNAYEDSEYSIWEDTRGGQYADLWSMSLSLNWSVDSTGTSYPPYSTWYRSWSDRRTGPDSNSVEKMQKAFGNSYSAVANESFTYTNVDGDTVQVDKGDGVWIDPDQMKTIGAKVNLTPESVSPEGSEWRAALSMEAPESSLNNGFKIDISGQDAGLGVNVNSNFGCLSSREDGGCKVVAESIEFEKDSSGNAMGELEKPMCGDDRHEYLIEQAGEAGSSKQYTGPYACAISLNSCYDSSAPEGQRIVDQNGYRDVNEPREAEGRLKDDREICQKISGQDDYALWYDQDYREDFCNQNTLYGQEGKRWFNAQYVADYPQAVRGGIDDSWNSYLAQQGHDNYTSDTTATASEVTVDGDITPVSTGTFENVTATLGFCGGDDESEYIVTQECNTRYCETDRSVQGVAKVPGSCVLRGSGGAYETSNSERSIYRPGEQVQITSVRGNPTIACFNGAWFADWPVNFNEQKIKVPLGGTRTASFDIVNIRDTETTFEVTMEQNSASPSADQFAKFVSQSGDTFTTTIKPASSKTFRIEFTGGNENLDIGDPGSTLTVRADGINSGLVGSDSVEVGIEPASNIAPGETGKTRDVPGIKAIQLIAMMVLSTLVFFIRRRS